MTIVRFYLYFRDLAARNVLLSDELQAKVCLQEILLAGVKNLV